MLNHKNALRLVIIGVLWITFSTTATAGQPTETVHRYVEQKGMAKANVLWRLARSNGFRLTYEKEAETHITQTDEHLATRTWSMENPEQNISVQAERKQDQIVLYGKVNGHPMGKQFQVDEAPWFQATSLSLRGLIRSQTDRVEFWTLRTDTLKAYKLKARKIGVERLTIEGKSVEAVKVELRISGWLAPFWNSFYWFRAEDGLFLKFEGLEDPSGTTKISIQYAGLVSPPRQDGDKKRQSTHPAPASNLPSGWEAWAHLPSLSRILRELTSPSDTEIGPKRYFSDTLSSVIFRAGMAVGRIYCRSPEIPVAKVTTDQSKPGHPVMRACLRVPGY